MKRNVLPHVSERNAGPEESKMSNTDQGRPKDEKSTLESPNHGTSILLANSQRQVRAMRSDSSEMFFVFFMRLPFICWFGPGQANFDC